MNNYYKAYIGQFGDLLNTTKILNFIFKKCAYRLNTQEP